MEDYFSYTQKLFNPADATSKPEALKGIRVLDFCHVIFGPVAARLLGDYGAEVIKLELPFSGDLWRPAGFWLRLFAWFVDASTIAIIVQILSVALSIALPIVAGF